MAAVQAEGVDTIALARTSWTEAGWPDAAPGMAAITSLMRAQAIVHRRVDAALREFAITFARYEVLMLLIFSERGSLPMSLIGKRLQVHQTSVTNAVDRLEGAGLVRREPHPDDGRAFLVFITPAGREVALSATAVVNREVFERPGLAPGDVEDLIGILAHLRRDAGDFG